MYDWNNDDGWDIAEEVLSEHHPLSIEKAQTPQAMSIHSSIATFKTSKEGNSYIKRTKTVKTSY